MIYRKLVNIMNTLFTLINAHVQYTLQKKSRGGRIIGIFLFLLILVKWDDWFYPIANKLGLVSIARESGLIQQTSVGTFFSVLAVIFVFLLIATLLMFAGTILSTIFLILPTPIQAIIILPIIIVLMPFYALFGKFKKKPATLTKEDFIGKETLTEEEYFKYVAEEEQRGLYNKLEDTNVFYRRGKLYFQQFLLENGDVKELTKEEARIRLNRVVSSFESPHNYVAAYTEKDGGGWYILGTQPLPDYLSDQVEYYGNYSLQQVMFGLNKFENKRTLYVPAQPFYIYWDSKWREYTAQLHYEKDNVYQTERSKRSAKMYDFDDFTVFYYINEGPFPNIYKHKNLLSMLTGIKKSHELAYLIPFYFKNELNKLAEGKPNFITAAKEISNYDTFGLLYMNDVETKLRELSEEGDMTAFKAYQAMKKSVPNKNID